MDDNNDHINMVQALRSIAKHLDLFNREYREKWLMPLIHEAENNNEEAIAELNRVAQQFKKLKELFNEIAEKIDPGMLN